MFLKTRYVSSVDKRCLGLIAGRNPLIYVCMCVCVCVCVVIMNIHSVSVRPQVVTFTFYLL